MRRFLCQIGVFLVIVIAVCTIPPYVFEQKAKDCTNQDPYASINKVSNINHVDADLIILGNCRANGGYDASLMTSLSGLQCLNLGWDGSSFDYCYHIMYKTYLKNNKKPRYIIVDIGPWAFFEHEAPVYTIQMLPYIKRPEFQFYIEMCPQLSNADKLLFVRYFGTMGKVFKEISRLNRPETIGSNKVDKGWRDDYFDKPHRLEGNKAIVQLFYSFLDECLSDEIKVILVCSPMHVKDGLSYFDMNNFWTIVKKCASGTGFPIISYAEYFGDDTTYFSTPAHLNKHGREIFTAKLIHDLDSVGIINAKTSE
jgi:hypothetical protein